MNVAAWILRALAVLAVVAASSAGSVGAAFVIAVLWGALELGGRAARSPEAPTPAPPGPPIGPDDDPGTGPLASLKTLLAALGSEAPRLEAGSPLLLGRLERLETELIRARCEVTALRTELVAEQREARVESAPPQPEPPAQITPERPPAPPSPPKEPGPSLWERLEGMGPRLFAWVGGAVMLLGIVFLFAFATRRGWIGPEARLVMAGVASAATLLAGIWVRRRHGALYSGLAAVGVGLAGLYTTILAAAALYEFLPPLGALLCAGIVAGVGTAVSVAWSAEIVAGLTLVGAMALPVASILQGERSLLGLGFVVIVMVAAAVVALARQWVVLLLAATAVSSAQLVVFVADSAPTDSGSGTILALAAMLWGTYVAIGIAYQLILKTSRLGWLTPTFVLTPGLMLALAASRLLATETAEGAFLLGLTAAYAFLGAALTWRRDQRELTTLLIGAASLVAVFGFADLLSGEPLTVVWSAQAVFLAWLGRRLGEVRFRIPAVGYLLLAVCHVLAVEAPPRELFEDAARAGAATWSVAVVAASTLAVGYLLPARADEVAGELDSEIADLTPWTRIAAFWASGMLALYSLSQAILWLAPSLETGHVALSAAWSAIGLGLCLAGLRRGWQQLERAGLSLLAVSVVETAAFDWAQLSSGQAAASFWMIASAVLVAGHAVQLARSAAPQPRAYVATLISVSLATIAVIGLLGGDGEGLGLLAVALVYGTFSAGCLRRRVRDLATLDWVLALILGTAGVAELFSGLALVAFGAAAVAALAWLSARIAERLLVGAAALLTLTLGYALVHLAPPADLFEAGGEPGLGAAAIALCAASSVVLGRFSQARERFAAWGTSGVLWLYALSVAVLAVAPSLASGHIALAATWSVIGLGLTAVGLRRQWPNIEGAGLTLIAFAVVEAAVFDWGHFSAGEAAASFWIVGTAALLAGHAEQLARPQRTSVEAIVSTLVGVGLATAALVRFLSGDAEGLGLLVLACVPAAFSAGCLRRGSRDLATLDWALALTLATAGVAELFSGIALVAIGAAGAAAVSMIAARAKEQRLLGGAAAVLALSFGYALVHDAQPALLFEASDDAAVGALAVGLCAASALVLAYLLADRRLRLVAAWACGVLVLFALSLAILALAPSFDAGHVALSAVWSAIGLGLCLAGLDRRSRHIEWAGLALLTASVLETIVFDWHHLPTGRAAACFLITAAAALVAGHAVQVARPARLSPEAFVATLVSFTLACTALVRLLSGDGEGVALLVLALVLGGFSAASLWRGLRDLATLDWVLALVLATSGLAELFSGLALVAFGAAAAAALAWLSSRIAERRLLVGSTVLLALTLGYALVREATPSELFQIGAEPGVGAAAISLCAASSLALARYCTGRERMAAYWASGALGLYGLSLAIMAVADALGGGSAKDTFQRGHTAVSGAWALVALICLYVGLTRKARTFQLLGFAIFGVVLAKIFFYDLPSLSSVTRALSFLAVGALLLTAGYFYQRLAQRPERAV